MAERYRVDCMTCQGCARSVAAALTRAAPAVKVEIDVAGGIVAVEGAMAVEAVKTAVEGAGFEFLGAA